MTLFTSNNCVSSAWQSCVSRNSDLQVENTRRHQTVPVVLCARVARWQKVTWSKQQLRLPFKRAQRH